MNIIPPPVAQVPVTIWRGAASAGTRVLPEETAVAMTYDRVSFAVMMASPGDLRDFAIGFSLSEGIIATPEDITDLEIVALPAGIECRMAIAPARRDALIARRRFIAGPAGCGLCGIDSLEQAIRPASPVTTSLTITPAQISAALARLPGLQVLNRETRAVHAAAFYNPENGEMLVREDVGRHNGLDKLIGAVSLRGDDPAQGVVLLTSRVSIELIQKTRRLWRGGAGCGVSAECARRARCASSGDNVDRGGPG